MSLLNYVPFRCLPASWPAYFCTSGAFYLVCSCATCPLCPTCSYGYLLHMPHVPCILCAHVLVPHVLLCPSCFTCFSYLMSNIFSSILHFVAFVSRACYLFDFLAIYFFFEYRLRLITMICNLYKSNFITMGFSFI